MGVIVRTGEPESGNPSPTERSPSTNHWRVRTRTKSPVCGLAGMVAPRLRAALGASVRRPHATYPDTVFFVTMEPTACYLTPVPAGSRLRGRISIVAADDAPPDGLRVTHGITIEIEGGERPACVAEMIAVHYR